MPQQIVPPCAFVHKDEAHQQVFWGKDDFLLPFYTALYLGFPYLPGANTNFQLCVFSSRYLIDIVIRNSHFLCSIELQIDYNTSLFKKKK